MLHLPRVIRAAALVPLAVAALALTGVTPASADRVIPPPVSGDVVFWQTNTGGSGSHCMQIDQWRADDFAPVDQFGCDYAANQGWTLGQVNGDPNVFWMKNASSGKCLDDYAFGMGQGNPIIQYKCLIGTNQQWRMIWSYNDGNAQFQNVNSGLCLSVDGINSSDYRRFVQNPCYGFSNERFDPVYLR
ncbi:RICIN domain-containing protein [Kutzneria buriramensis]|uniref:Ricin-type beta-trefoil lectin protein n=1 Tax=Kutzneria buriramensis TaxID=1045776 RepID=A0A3E0HI02_9PSEU|nr:RICIN domain-containing protein [Kutzneria buriramensis]REH45990.1 ricin-type beta-trefoil lectin protein [Kutzneria buriramensis]